MKYLLFLLLLIPLPVRATELGITLGNERKKLSAKQNGVDLQRETFLLNLQMQTAQLLANIESLCSIMELDDEIIALRENVQKSAEAKQANGTMSIADVLREVNATAQARQAKAIHEVERLMKVAEYKQLIMDNS